MGLAFAFTLITVVELDGRKTVGFSPVRMFRALLSDLLESKNEELESYLNELGVDTEISVAEFAFRRKSDHSVKASCSFPIFIQVHFRMSEAAFCRTYFIL